MGAGLGQNMVAADDGGSGILDPEKDLCECGHAAFRPGPDRASARLRVRSFSAVSDSWVWLWLTVVVECDADVSPYKQSSFKSKHFE